VSDFDEYQAYIHTNFRDVAPGGFYLGNNDTATPLLSYRINGSPGYAGLAKNLADSYLLNTAINVQFSTFALPFLGSTGDSLQLILYITLGLCVYPAFLALYPTFERVKNVRALVRIPILARTYGTLGETSADGCCFCSGSIIAAEYVLGHCGLLTCSSMALPSYWFPSWS